MDALSSPSDNLDVSTLSPTERQDLQQFALAESQKARLQGSIHKLTDVCFRKCVTSKISQGQLDRYEQPCVAACVERFMDANVAVIKHLETLRSR